MAYLRDVVPAVRRVGFVKFCLNLWARISRDNLFVWASALAYSWLFAIFPFLIFLLTLVPFVPERYKGGLETRMADTIKQSLPDQAASTIISNINDVLSRPRSGLLSVGILLTLWAASGGMSMTMSAIDKCVGVDVVRPFYKQKPLAVILTVSVASLIISVLVLIPLGNVVNKFLMEFLNKYVPQMATVIIVVWTIFRYAVALFFLFMVLAIMYKFGPGEKQKWIFFSPGAVFSVVVWILLGVSFRLYVNKFGKYDQTYGTVGGVAVLLLFFYIDALVLLIGAEINSEIEASKAAAADASPAATNDVKDDPAATA